MEQTLFILGVNHRTAPVAMRERLAYADDEIVSALARLKERADAVSEAALISTCNRVEIIGVTGEADRALAQCAEFIAADRGIELDTFDGALYQLAGRDAARHLFRVGASLDSMVLGEPQILGQVKAAYANAAEAGYVGMVLHRAFHKAFSVAKRVRRATLIGRGAVSASSAAVALAGQIFDSLADKTVMLMGAGKMAELTARQLHALGVESLIVTSRTFDHAVALARNLGGTAVPFDNHKRYLRIADVVIGSVAATRPIIEPGEFEAIVKERRYKPIFLIDLGVPRNFDARINALANVYLYDVDDLARVVDNSRADREREATRAEEIVELELESFWRWMNGLDLVPTIKDIRYSFDQLRALELGRHRGWLAGLDPAERERIEDLTRGLTNKLLHRILTGLRECGPYTSQAAYAAEVARRLLCGSTEGVDLDALGESDIEDDDDL